MDFGKRVLAIVAHCDDEVLGAGGLLHKLASSGTKVAVAIVCPGGVRGRKGVTIDYVHELMNQSQDAARIIGVDEENVEMGPFMNTELSHEEVPRRMVHYWIEEVIKKLNPDSIITHSENELHADHRIVSEAVKVAARPNAKRRKVLHFEPISVYQDGFQPNFFVSMSEEDIAAKEQAMSCYKGEIQKDTYGWRTLRAIRSKAVARGLECGMEMAEAYLVARDYA